MFNRQLLIRFGLLYFVLFFIVSFRYLSKLENDKRKSIPTQTHRLSIIVPFRNRSKQLFEFLPHMSSFLNYQSVNHLFIIVNQVDQHRFNRAALINIGFLESRTQADYLVMHDVDLLPLNRDELSYRYPSNGPIHLASPEYHPIYNYSKYAGGVLLITCDDFERINGMSPLYWGWGTEDDNFYVRMKLAQMKIYRPHQLSTNRTNTFRHIHDRQENKRDMAKYFNQKQEGRKLRPDMGWNTTEYKVVRRKIEKTSENVEYTMLDVEIDCDYNSTPWCDHPAIKNT